VAYSLDSRDPNAHIPNLHSQHVADHMLTFARLDVLFALEPGFERMFTAGSLRARSSSRASTSCRCSRASISTRGAALETGRPQLVVAALGNSRLLYGNAFPLVASRRSPAARGAEKAWMAEA
jgi:hypothetical protein